MSNVKEEVLKIFDVMEASLEKNKENADNEKHIEDVKKIKKYLSRNKTYITNNKNEKM